jgi:DNA-binding protein HU-beta
MPLVPSLTELSDKLLRYTERTFAHAFELVQKLTQVKDIYDVTRLQTEFIQAQVHAMSELVSALGRNANKAMTAASKTPTPNAAQPTVILKHIAGALAERHGTTRKRMEELLNGAIALIAKHLKKGDRVRIGGLGTLQVRSRAARAGRNPATGAQIAIKAGKAVAFRASKNLNENVSGAS